MAWWNGSGGRRWFSMRPDAVFGGLDHETLGRFGPDNLVDSGRRGTVGGSRNPGKRFRCARDPGDRRADRQDLAGPVKPAAWWSPDHTFLHDAGNLSLEARPGGEWRETLSGGGGLTHLVVIYLALLSILRLEGALGTLQVLGVADHPTFSLEDQGAATLTTATYEVGGHENGGFDSMAAAVGHVLDAQLGRLKTYVETGATPWTSKSFPILV